MIQDPKVGDVVSLAPGQFHKHLEKDKQYVITAVNATYSHNAIVSLATVEKMRNKYGRYKHLGSWSGIWCIYLQRHDFLTAVRNATKGKRSAA